jgi:hypothetical protein
MSRKAVRVHSSALYSAYLSGKRSNGQTPSVRYGSSRGISRGRSATNYSRFFDAEYEGLGTLRFAIFLLYAYSHEHQARSLSDTHSPAVYHELGTLITHAHCRRARAEDGVTVPG